jgi:hypothetical protein
MITATWDMFPADVTLPDGTGLTGVRVLVTTSDMVLIYSAEGERTLQAWAGAITGEATLANPYAPRFASESTIPTAAGTVTVIRGAGCGCSSPLKYANLAALGIT